MKEPVNMLFDEYKNNLFIIAFSICKNICDAEDVVKDAFIEYIVSNKNFETKEHIKQSKK